jgi:predicted transcriptional regulator
MELEMAKRELSDPITLRLPADVLSDIEVIAEVTDRTRSWVMVRALKLYLASEGRDILAAVEGRRQIAAGRSHDMDDVLGEIDAITDDKVA